MGHLVHIIMFEMSVSLSVCVSVCVCVRVLDRASQPPSDQLREINKKSQNSSRRRRPLYQAVLWIRFRKIRIFRRIISMKSCSKIVRIFLVKMNWKLADASVRDIVSWIRRLPKHILPLDILNFGCSFHTNFSTHLITVKSKTNITIEANVRVYKCPRIL